ncbi:hypothetical protein [Sinorhizobium sp. RAC02]|uniref:hypothetical protein n=1 Tax=Sinorhizobium sp. RAC02 TaxID=1842534 RepID=UPI00083E5838|nr:hypothetical protein [Sinorhizobium sp. RAC02]AOF91243.1 hypothetical protein BSY16_3498 [Sinorhizobium sp. RAC02]
MNAFRAKKPAQGRIDLLPPEPKAPAQKHGQRPVARLEVVDADFVVIRSGSARTSNDNHRTVRPTPSRAASKHLFVRTAAASARLCEAGLQLLSGRAFAGLVTASVIFVFAYAGGLSALKAALPTAEPTTPLRVTDVVATVEDQNGMKVLSVYGRIDNVSSGTQSIPPLDIAFDTAGTSRRVALDRESIAAGGSEHFALRIPHGGGKVPKVSVSLAGEGAPAN